MSVGRTFSRRTLLALLSSATAGRARAAVPLDVLASFSILADLTRATGGARVRVRSLIGPNISAHGYQPLPSDARAVAAADVMIINGLGFEGWAERLASSAGFKGMPIVASRGVAALRAGHDGHGHAGSFDPHAWQDVTNAKRYVGNIRDGLIRADPASADDYAAATARYLGELDRLDTDIRAAWAPIPRASRRILTSHEAFAYYGDAYGVDFLAPQSLDAHSEPTPRQLAALIAEVRVRQIRALFVESVANPRIMRQIADDTGARIGPPVYADALSDSAGTAPSYLAMMRHNTAAFVAALR